MQPARPLHDPATQTKKPGLGRLFLLLGCGAGLVAFFGLLCCGGLVFWELRNYQVNSDFVQIGDALRRMTDLDVTEGLVPSTTSTNSRTNLERVEYRSPGGNSYFILVTWNGQQLRHQDTLKDSADRGTVVGGGRPEQPSQSRTINLTVRNQPAEFIVRRFARFETVSGYFQGKTTPVFLDAKFDLGDFAAGTAERLVKAIESGAAR